MTVTLLTMQTLTGSGTAVTTLLPYPLTSLPKISSDLHELQKWSWTVRGSSCSICSILATPLFPPHLDCVTTLCCET